ncbi:MAG TPA: redox-regulated ATPase YchF [Anaerolineaceae bacterium]|jgi:GTP-binding protein YchF|nr:redox-regulated ATPase YchF [Anaerolineaceae bacterium]
MQLGIIGLPQSGKTTVYKALTGADIPTEISAGHLEVHTSVVDVPDPRVEKLCEIYKPKKIVRAKVTYADIAGLDGSAGRAGLPGVMINQLAQMDGFLHVVRQFENASVPHVAGDIEPVRDIQTMDIEFILNDLVMIERRLQKLREEHRRGVSRPRDVIQTEIDLFERLEVMLNEEKPLRYYTFTSEEEKIVSSFGFLSRKPQIIVFNQSEDQSPIEYTSPHPHTTVVSLPAKLEMDIMALEPEDVEIFMEEYGVGELGMSRLIKVSYDLLNVHSFFTAGEKEVHVWTLRKGSNAREAAGTIHSDMEKGFIRAEVVSFDDLVTYGSTAEARNHGRLRVEGKNYIIEDGDIIEIRFNI